MQLTLVVDASTARMCVTAQITEPGCERDSRFSVELRRSKHRYTAVGRELVQRGADTMIIIGGECRRRTGYKSRKCPRRAAVAGQEQKTGFEYGGKQAGHSQSDPCTADNNGKTSWGW